MYQVGVHGVGDRFIFGLILGRENMLPPSARFRFRVVGTQSYANIAAAENEKFGNAFELTWLQIWIDDEEW